MKLVTALFLLCNFLCRDVAAEGKEGNDVASLFAATGTTNDETLSSHGSMIPESKDAAMPTKLLQDLINKEDYAIDAVPVATAPKGVHTRHLKGDKATKADKGTGKATKDTQGAARQLKGEKATKADKGTEKVNKDTQGGARLLTRLPRPTMELRRPTMMLKEVPDS